MTTPEQSAAESPAEELRAAAALLRGPRDPGWRPMSTSEPTTAESLAAALRAANEEWQKFQNSISAELDPDADYFVFVADELLRSGLAVVELPEAVVGSRYMQVASGVPIFEVEVPSPDGRGWEITGQHVPGFTEDRITVEGGIGWSSTERARTDALRILAACAAVDRLRAEHSGGEPR